MRLLPLALALLAAGCAHAQSPTDMPVGRWVNRDALWSRPPVTLISGFTNMYNLDIVHNPAEADYPYRGFFFGWAREICNGEIPGCDAIFAARAKAIDGPWEIFSGFDDAMNPRWTSPNDPAEWQPIIHGEDRWFDSWHQGDPSVVLHDGFYHMAYSATGRNTDDIPFGQPGDTDSDISVVMAAVSPDGLSWAKADAPILVYGPNKGQAPIRPGEYLHERGLYHRPSLMREDGAWKIWFDAFVNEKGFQMLHATNDGAFMDASAWTIKRGMDEPCIEEFPNPEVHKIDGLYFAWADPGGYPGEGWATRWTTEAVSLDGENWMLLGAIEADPGKQASHVPEVFVEQLTDDSWKLWLNYGSQIPGDYQYDEIRLRARVIPRAEIDGYKALLEGVSGPARRTPRPDGDMPRAEAPR